MDKKVWKQWWFKIVLLVIPVLLYYLVPSFQEIIQNAVKVLSRVDVDAAREYILSFGIWAPVVSFFLMVFQSVAAPLPAFVITFANAGLFGWIKGAALSWTSAMVGAILCFAIARLYGRSVVEKFTTRRALKEVDIFFEKYGKWAVLIARLLPFVSFDIVSYAAGFREVFRPNFASKANVPFIHFSFNSAGFNSAFNDTMEFNFNFTNLREFKPLVALGVS